MTAAGDSHFEKILREEFAALSASERKVLRDVWDNKDDFIKWPARNLLLWPGETTAKYHTYPSSIVSKLKKAGITRVNTLRNGPAIMAYRLACGIRPDRRIGKQGTKECWDIHHIYDGRFAFPPNDSVRPLHAVKDGRHFTRTGGLVAIHPIAHACADEYFWFSWQLRREAFRRFHYDPNGVFRKYGN